MLIILVAIILIPLCMALCIKNIGIFEIGKKEFSLYYVYFTSASVLAEYKIKPHYTMILVLLSVLFTLYILHKQVISVIVLTVLTFIIFRISDALARIVFLFVVQKNVYNIEGDIYVLHLVFSSIIIYLISKKIGEILSRFPKSILHSRMMLFVSLYLTVLLAVIYFNHIMTTYLGNKTNVVYVVLNGIICFIYFCFSVVLSFIILQYLIKEKKYQFERQTRATNEKYILELEESNSDLRKVKHDYKNILISLKSFIDDDNMEDLRKYFYKDFNELNRTLLNQDTAMVQLSNLKISELKSILAYKISLAEARNIQLTIEIREQINNIGISTAILVHVLGILLDNAIEATSEVSLKELKIAIFRNISSTTFVIENTYKPTKDSINQLFESGFSTKGEGRGIGLSTVRDYMNRYTNSRLETERTDKYFTQILTIKDK